MGPGPRHWHWHCQTRSYLHFGHCIWMTSIEPSRLWDSEIRASYREIPNQILAVDVMAGGGGGAGPAPSIRHQAPSTQAGLCTMLPVRFSMNWYELVCTDINLPVTIYSGMYKYTHSPVSMKPYVLVCTGMYQYIPEHTGIYQHLL